ncbi:MAG TPA: lysylphosphatidylglycerol synthase transmembrane domain-containing protein [Dermatophilaceae bacterium]
MVDASRSRRPTDVLMLVLSVLFLVVLWWPAPGPTRVDTNITRLLGDLTGAWTLVWDLSYATLVLWPLLLVVLVCVSRGRRRLLVDWMLALVAATALALVIGDLAGTPWSVSFASLTSSGPPQVYLAVRVALASAVVATASPHLSRPFRLTGRLVLAFGAISAVALGVAYPVGVVAGLAAGLGAAALAHLILGSPGGELSDGEVSGILAELGLSVSGVQTAPIRTVGVVLKTAVDQEGALLIKVYGRDAWDSQFLGGLWTAAVRRGERPHLGRSRQGQLEHEAVATLVAERAGVPVLREVKVGQSADGDAVLVSRLRGRRLSQLSADDIDEHQLHSAWRSLVRLHDEGLSHGRIDGDRLLALDDGTVALADLAEADLVASRDAKVTDRARLLATTTTLVGHERSVPAALAVLTGPGLAEVLPYLQPAVLDRTTRRAVKNAQWDLTVLRDAAAQAAGVEPPTLQRVRRVSFRSVLVAAGGTLFAYAVISRLLGVDFSAIFSELAGANWWWVALALLLSPAIQATYAVGTMGASIKPLRYGPVAMLQYAIQFIALAMPATAARLALDVRFFQRFGVVAAGAIAIGLIDSVGGFAVQVVLIALIALTDLPGLTAPLRPTSTSSATAASGPSLLQMALILVAVVVLVAALTWLIPSARRRATSVIPKARATIVAQRASAQEALQVLRRPSKVTQMLAGNLSSQLIQAGILGMCLHAFGADAQLSQLVLVNTLVVLFAGFMPVPGGIGVAEAGYIAGLQAIGVESAVAISTALAFRLVTFYLPPLWGSAAMRWLRRNQYV